MRRNRLAGEGGYCWTYVRPVLRLTPARNAETSTASKAKWVRRPSWEWVLGLWLWLWCMRGRVLGGGWFTTMFVSYVDVFR